MLMKIALLLLIGCGVNHLGLGVVYITADEFMGYHSRALAVEWSALDPSYQTLFLALIRLCGAGAIIAAVVNLYLSVHALFTKDFRMVWLAPAVALMYQLTANYVVYTVAEFTPGDPPLMFVSIGSLVTLAGALLLGFAVVSNRRTTSRTGRFH